MPTSPTSAALSTGLLLLLAAACAGDPAARIEARRAKYSAELTGFVVKEAPAVALPEIVLDVLVSGAAKPPLSGLTLDLSMADAAGKEKVHRRVWVETSTVGPGGEQKSLTLTDLGYAAGDGFWVEVRSPIPAAERGDYREFGAGR